MDGRICYSVIIALASVVSLCKCQDVMVDRIAQFLQPKFSVITNFGTAPNTVQAQIDLYNSGSNAIEKEDWSLFLCHIRLFEPSYLGDPAYSGGVPIGDSGLTLYHIDGCLYRLSPTDDFQSIPANTTRAVQINSGDWMVSTTDIMPNWYVVGNAEGSAAKVIQFTADETLPHAGPFDSSEKWKRTASDVYNPPTPQLRSQEYAYDTISGTTVPHRVVPTPLDESGLLEDFTETDSSWKIYAEPVPPPVDQNLLNNEAEYLAEKTGWTVMNTEPSTMYVHLKMDVASFEDSACKDNPHGEAYMLNVTEDVIYVTGESTDGVFYGVQTLLAMKDLNDEDTVQKGVIVDCPRYGFRGLMVDVSRNFYPKETIKQVLHGMAAYKLNKFHFHLTDDEGWRLEIPDLPELTTIGAKRCHDLSQTTCLIPQLGSGPSDTTSGTGYYTTADYEEILLEAKKLHIEVIPEFDMPGHGHAAIRAMEARYHDLIDSDPDAAEEYLLSDFDDTSAYYTAQWFKDNAINPCVPSVITFVSKVIAEVGEMHKNQLHPLLHYHFGGDEVAHTAWINSTKCKEIYETVDNDELKKVFAVNVSTLLNDYNEGKSFTAGLGSWEDGLMDANNNPFSLSDMGLTDIYTNTWSNIWEWGQGDRAYKFANAGYQVVLSHATHLYFDHPHEPSPSERGYYWATRFAATEKTFGYMPDDIYANIDTDRMGNPITKDEICGTEGISCVELEEDKRENIIGIQGQLFSETSRTPEYMFSMILPRMLALAERAWHKAPWEDEENIEERNIQRKEDWSAFASHLGHHELQRLEEMGLSYHLRPPAATVSDGNLVARAEFPGLQVQYNIDDAGWLDYNDEEDISIDETMNILLRTKAEGFARYSVEDVLNYNGASTLRFNFTAWICLTILILYSC